MFLFRKPSSHFYLQESITVEDRPKTPGLSLIVLYCTCFVCDQLVVEKRLLSEDVGHLYSSVLLALQTHGQHEASQAMLVTLALQAYELLVRKPTSIFESEIAPLLRDPPIMAVS